jgi:HD-like signal output (HDOD) protein
MSANVTSTPLKTSPNIAFEFVRSLAGELTAGKVDLPSFPEIAIRVRRVLSDPKSSGDQVVRVVGSEPALAARLMRIANSASLNRSGRAVGDLRTAINRIGHNMVRSAAISFAMAQIRNANKLKGLERYLKDIWECSTLVAAYSLVLARTYSKVNPDEAMLAGIMHGIGKLYVLTRAISHPELFVDTTILDGILKDWHASIGKAILENWEFSDEMAAAVGDQNDHTRDGPGAPDLRDVIAVAIVLASHHTNADGIDEALDGLATAKRFGLNKERARLMMRECAVEVTALTNALGDE